MIDRDETGHGTSPSAVAKLTERGARADDDRLPGGAPERRTTSPTMVAATATPVRISSDTMLNSARPTTMSSGRAITGASRMASNRLSLMALRRKSDLARRRNMRPFLPENGVAFVAAP